jgi:hypothetical protein
VRIPECLQKHYAKVAKGKKITKENRPPCVSHEPNSFHGRGERTLWVWNNHRLENLRCTGKARAADAPRQAR